MEDPGAELDDLAHRASAQPGEARLGFRLGDRLEVELGAVETIASIHVAQVLSDTLLRRGIERVIQSW